MPFDYALLIDLLIAAGIGGLLGLEREHSARVGPEVKQEEAVRRLAAGSRTFPLVSLLGALTYSLFPSLLLAAFVAVAAMTLMAYGAKVWLAHDVGLTTAVASLLTFVYGVMVVLSPDARTLAVILAVLTTAVLAMKRTLHEFAQRIEPDERLAAIKFLILSLVLLPLLPDEEIDFLFGLNPRFVWLMVVFIAAIDLAGYVLVKFLGPRKGIGLTGAVGGLISSTATTVSLSTRTRERPAIHRVAGLAIFAASVIMLARILLEVAVVNASLLVWLVPPFGLVVLVGGTVGYVGFRRASHVDVGDVDIRSPFRLTPALVFGGFFAAVLVVVDLLAARLGSVGVYGSALLSGVFDVDAITLSLARLASEGVIDAPTASTGILLAAIINTAVKLGLAAFLGTRRLGRFLLPYMGGIWVGGLLGIFFVQLA